MKEKVLVIQTAFTGDVILATALTEKLFASQKYVIDVLVRKGNDSLLINHPFLNKVLVWNKKENKYSELIKLIKAVRQEKYDHVINLQRFGATGLLTALSGARITSGFSKNPFSLFFTHKHPHIYNDGLHETQRNQKLIAYLTENISAKPKLYPSAKDFEKIADISDKPFVTIFPGSVWFTKTFPSYKWIELIQLLKSKGIENIFLLGAPNESELADSIISKSGLSKESNLCGKLSLLESAALMTKAKMNYVNDSAPLHLASATNSPVTAVYCSTVPAFGFYPLSDNAKVVQTEKELWCKPCGIHGYKKCPLNHFMCANTIEIEKVI